MTRKGSKSLDSIFFGANLVVTGLSTSSFAKSVANYFSQANALTEKVYSMVDRITPEVVEQSNEMVRKFAEQPSYFNGILLGLGSGLSLYYALRLGNPRNYEE